VPPIAVARQGPRAVARWLRAAAAALRPMELDGLSVRPVAFLAPPRPWSYPSWGAWIAPALRRALATERFDLLHAHNVLPTGDAVARGAAHPRFVVSTHGPDIIHVAERSARAAAATRRTLLRAAGVIANSRWAAERCAQLAAAPLPGRVVHLGAEVPQRTPARHGRPTIVTVSHLQARKRHGVVMRALLAGATPEQVHEATRIDPWFVDQLVLIKEVADQVRGAPELTADVLRLAKRHGDTRLNFYRSQGVSASRILQLLGRCPQRSRGTCPQAYRPARSTGEPPRT